MKSDAMINAPVAAVKNIRNAVCLIPPNIKQTWPRNNYTLPLGIYKHYKGHEYRLIGFAKHSESLEDLAIYEDTDDSSKWWARPLAMFNEEIEINGKKIKRFTLIENN